MIDQIHPEHKGKNGIYTHSVICINPSLIVQHNDFQERVEMMRKLMKSIDSQVKMPGESSREKSTKALDAGSIDISDELADRLNSLANDIGIRPI
jgi:LDH2 family malate/lactate/ureidoglycolate dehydrogenase